LRYGSLRATGQAILSSVTNSYTCGPTGTDALSTGFIELEILVDCAIAVVIESIAPFEGRLVDTVTDKDGISTIPNPSLAKAIEFRIAIASALGIILIRCAVAVIVETIALFKAR
tara:strand:+ start:1437 stop:1781 length:345 start_codon:yes stop_codon:yes gene_type:complete